MTPVPAEAFPRRDEDVAAFAQSLGLPGIVDVHVHVLPNRLQSAVWRYFDQLDDPPWPVTYRTPEPTRRQTLRELGVVAHTALAYAHRPGMAADLNDHTLELAARDERVIPSFTLYPEPGVEAVVAGALARGGQVAKVHLQVGRFHATDPRLDDAWRQLEAARAPIVLHASAVYGVDGGDEFCGAPEVAALLDRHPDLVIVVAHLGGPDFAEFLDLAERYDTLRFDTAMVLTADDYLGPLGRDLVERVAALHDRVLFGSDFPTIPHPYASQVRGLARLQLDEAGLRRVLHGSAVELLGRVARPD